MASRLLTDKEANGCGMGEGANCCIFLILGTEGFECAQRSEMADMLYNRVRLGQTSARRTPESDFPSCQQEGRVSLDGPPQSFMND